MYIYRKELAQMIVEAGKPQDLHLASWRPRRATGVVPVQIRKIDIPAQGSQAGVPPTLSHSIQAFN